MDSFTWFHSPDKPGVLVPQLLHVADNMDHNPQPVVEQENRGSQFDSGLAYEDQPLSHCDRLEAELFRRRSTSCHINQLGNTLFGYLPQSFISVSA